MTLEHKAKEVYYLDKGFDKVDTKFVGIESFRGKCKATFSSKFRLYKHLKDGYISCF